MTNEKEIFQRDTIRTGGFYELCIQVCPSIERTPIELYTNYIWSLENVKGPFDRNFNKVDIDFNNCEHQGLLDLNGYVIPFITFNIREDEPIATGFNWFDISFYTSAIEDIFGKEYKTWTEDPKAPPIVDRFFISLISDLMNIYRFQLAIIDFEISGQFYLNDLRKPLTNNYSNARFFIGTEHGDLIDTENKKWITIID